MDNELFIEMPLETSVIVSQAIAQIYRAARSHSLDKFKCDALEQFNDVIAFDGASWLSFTNAAELGLAGANCQYQLDGQFWSQYHAKFINWLHDFNASQDVTQNCYLFQLDSEGELPATLEEVGLKTLLLEHGIHQQLVLINCYQEITHVICLFRHQKAMAFDQFELDTSQFIVNNLSRAYRFHLERRVEKTSFHGDGTSAICNDSGQLLCASEHFITQTQSFAANWQQVLQQRLAQHVTLPLKLEFDRHKMMVSRDEIFLRLELYPFDEMIETLTNREFEVLKLMSQGSSIDDTADILGIKYRTVDNHVSSIHRKFGVSKSSEMVSVMLHSRYLLSH